MHDAVQLQGLRVVTVGVHEHGLVGLADEGQTGDGRSHPIKRSAGPRCRETDSRQALVRRSLTLTLTLTRLGLRTEAALCCKQTTDYVH